MQKSGAHLSLELCSHSSDVSSRNGSTITIGTTTIIYWKMVGFQSRKGQSISHHSEQQQGQRELSQNGLCSGDHTHISPHLNPEHLHPVPEKTALYV